MTSPSSATGGPVYGPPVKYGISDPISLQRPTETDQALSERMMRELEEEFPAETPEGMAHRQAVLQELERIVIDWTTEVGVASGMTEEEARQNNAKITTLGSFRLGVVHPGSDIDTLCIGPPHVSREDFFTAFVEKLNQQEYVTECVPIPDAYTPIIKLKMRGVLIDLLFARLVRPLGEGEDPEEVVKEDEVLKNMDERSVRCINGFRVANQILQLVPDQETFRQTLRFVKYWARRRSIYSNVLGFFGGITWSLLVARVCQLYPYSAPSHLVNRFFRLYHQWNWSVPVVLCRIVEPRDVPGMTGFKVWNPKTNPADKQHVMPVITPAFPAMNSTHNVTETTKRILLEEFSRGYEIVNNIEAQTADWSDVHEPFPYFTQFHHFLWLEVLAKSDEVYKKFSGWVESKLRILMMQLESVNGMIIHPNPNQYDLRDTNGEWPLGCGMFIAMAFSEEAGAMVGQTVDLRPAWAQFLNVISQWSEKDTYRGEYLLKLNRINGSKLPDYALEPEAAKKRPRRDAGARAAAAPAEARASSPEYRERERARESGDA